MEEAFSLCFATFASACSAELGILGSRVVPQNSKAPYAVRSATVGRASTGDSTPRWFQRYPVQHVRGGC